MSSNQTVPALGLLPGFQNKGGCSDIGALGETATYNFVVHGMMFRTEGERSSLAGWVGAEGFFLRRRTSLAHIFALQY